MKREATCSCGQLSIQVKEDPFLVASCSCLTCQKRTGSVFGVSSYFKDDQVIKTKGESNNFSSIGDSGLSVNRKFCPTCGSTVFWNADFLPGHTGVAVGAFADPNFPEPVLAAWTKSKHKWLTFPDHWASSETQDFDQSIIE